MAFLQLPSPEYLSLIKMLLLFLPTQLKFVLMCAGVGRDFTKSSRNC